MTETTTRMIEAVTDSIRVRQRLLEDAQLMTSIEQMASAMVEIYRQGGKLLIAGNGGSAADAQHFAAEITCQYKLKRKGRPALALHCDTSAITAWGNDYAFKSFFARQVEAYGVKGDGVVLITTSGNSENLVEAAEAARTKGIHTFGLLGRDGGELVKGSHCDQSVIVPSEDTPRIQECHIMLIHMLCEELDKAFYAQDQAV